MRRRELMLHAAGWAIGKARGNNWVKTGKNPMPRLGTDGQFEIGAIHKYFAICLATREGSLPG